MIAIADRVWQCLNVCAFMCVRPLTSRNPVRGIVL